MSTPPRLWRNGMDYEPKKTYPPDYSNVPNVRDWQMSPFSKERFDLNEIEIAKKKGLKNKAEVERLEKLYLGKGQDTSLCPVPAEKEKTERESRKIPSKKDCHLSYRYQPYGPTYVSALSCNRTDSRKPKLYSVLGPSLYSDFGSKKNEFQQIVFPCEGSTSQEPGRQLKTDYIPYGPFGKVNLSPDIYVPMGPSVTFK